MPPIRKACPSLTIRPRSRWLVPMDTPASLHVRTLIEPVSTYALLDDLCLVFGDL